MYQIYKSYFWQKKILSFFQFVNRVVTQLVLPIPEYSYVIVYDNITETNPRSLGTGKIHWLLSILVFLRN